MQRDDRDIEKLLETTDWEPEPDPVREQASLVRLLDRLGRRRHTMRVVARTSMALCIALIALTAGTAWYRWTQPMVVAVQETRSFPVGVMRLIQTTSGVPATEWQVFLARATRRDPRGLLASVRSVPGTDLLRAELSGGAGYVLVLLGQGVVGVVAPSSKSAHLVQGFTAIVLGDAPDITAQDIAAAKSIASNDAAVAQVGLPADDALQVASVYQSATPYEHDQHMVSFDPFVLSTPSGYVRMRRIVAVFLQLHQEGQTLLTVLVDIDARRVVGIVDTTHVAGILLTEDAGPQVVLVRQ